MKILLTTYSIKALNYDNNSEETNVIINLKNVDNFLPSLLTTFENKYANASYRPTNNRNNILHRRKWIVRIIKHITNARCT